MFFRQSYIFIHIECYYILEGNDSFKAENTNILNGNAPDLDAECARYEEKIKSYGGIELSGCSFGSPTYSSILNVTTFWKETIPFLFRSIKVKTVNKIINLLTNL